MRMSSMTAASLLLAAGLLLPSGAAAQQRRKPKAGGAQQTIEIRGQVPTPQVVTVRPREIPNYTRDVLTTNFYDRSFWPSILPAYQLVPQRQVGAAAPLDTAPAATGVAGVPIAVVPPGAANRLSTQGAGTGAAAAATGATAGAAGAGPAGAAAANDQRQREINEIRRELQMRRARLDSLNRIVNDLGRPKKGGAKVTPQQSPASQPTPSRDSTGTKPPR